MTARTLDGQSLAKAMQEEIRPEVAAFTAQHGRPPGLGIVLVGDNPASEVYVRNKLKAGAEVGFRADLERLPASAAVSDAIALVERLNRSDLHDGILVQSPLPKAMGAGAEQHVFDRTREGRRRADAGQRWPAGTEASDSRRVHAIRDYRAARSGEHPDCRTACRRHRTQ
jgi:hypothetical protein